MIDLQGRYLPWVERGAKSLEEGLRLLRTAQADGVRSVVLTPAVDPDRYPNTRAELERKFAAFAQLVERRGIAVQLRLGAEVVHRPTTLEWIDRGDVPMLGDWEGHRVLLWRWNEEFIPIGALSTTRQLIERGILPMLARPEQNPGVVRSPSALEFFVRDGCLIQLDAGSLLGLNGPTVRDTAFRLVEVGWATVIAGGCADTADRPSLMREARDIVAQRFGEEIALRLTRLNPSLVFGDEAAPVPFESSATTASAEPERAAPARGAPAHAHVAPVATAQISTAQVAPAQVSSEQAAAAPVSAAHVAPAPVSPPPPDTAPSVPEPSTAATDSADAAAGASGVADEADEADEAPERVADVAPSIVEPLADLWAVTPEPFIGTPRGPRIAPAADGGRGRSTRARTPGSAPDADAPLPLMRF